MMNKTILLTATVALSLGASSTAFATTQAEDIAALKAYYAKKWPTVKDADMVNGAYALSEDKRINWESMRDFPPYEDHLAKGEALWNKKFKNGNSFATCFGEVSTVRNRFPHWNAKEKKVETLEGNIIKCQKANGEKPFKTKKGNIAYLSAWIASQANGQTINVKVPQNDKDAVAAYEAGRQFFYAKRGQLNMACADCHVYQAGMYARGNLLSPVRGHTTHFPVWRGKWAKSKGDGFGTLQRRYSGCNAQVRAKPFKVHGKEYNNLEYFHASMSNGMKIEAPDYRE